MKFITATFINGQTALVAVPHVLAITADRTTQGSKIAMSSYKNDGMAVKEPPVELVRELRESGLRFITAKVKERGIAHIVAEKIQVIVPEAGSEGCWVGIDGHDKGGIFVLQGSERVFRSIQETLAIA